MCNSLKTSAAINCETSGAIVELTRNLDIAYKDIMDLYVTTGWENQLVFDDYLKQTKGEVSNKILAAGVVAYRRAREATLLVYPNVNKTLIELLKKQIQLAVVSDAPSREAWMRLYYLNLHHDKLLLLFFLRVFLLRELSFVL